MKKRVCYLYQLVVITDIEYTLKNITKDLSLYVAAEL
jgi:hypothetical protein